MTEQDMAREVAWPAFTAELVQGDDYLVERMVTAFRIAFDAGMAHGRAEAWREIEVIAGDSLPRDWGRIAREVREVRG